MGRGRGGGNDGNSLLGQGGKGAPGLLGEFNSRDNNQGFGGNNLGMGRGNNQGAGRGNNQGAGRGNNQAAGRGNNPWASGGNQAAGRGNNHGGGRGGNQSGGGSLLGEFDQSQFGGNQFGGNQGNQYSNQQYEFDTVGRNVILSKLPPSARHELVLGMCEAYGVVKSLQLDPQRRSARVTYATYQQANMAADMLNDHNYNGSCIGATLA